MKRYLLIRLLITIASFFAIISIVYLSASIFRHKPWVYEFSFIEHFKLEFPNYLSFMRNVVLKWDWGSTTKELTQELFDKYTFNQMAGITVKIVVYTFIFSIGMGVLLGFISALNKDSLIDKIITGITLVISSLPVFIVSYIFIQIVGFRLMLLPPRFSAWQYAHFPPFVSYVIPIIALSLLPISKFHRLVRGELIEEFRSSYILLLRVKGLRKRHIMWRHLLKNALVAIMPELTGVFIYMLGISFVVEIEYGVYGIGRLLFAGLFSLYFDGNYVDMDLSVVMSLVGFYIAIAMIGSFIIDVLYTLLDPRISMLNLD